MKLNTAEALLVNNPIRAQIQRRYEAPLLRKLGGTLQGATVLEVGCGQGSGVPILLRQFEASQVYAIDLDPRQIRRARQKLAADSRSVALAVASADCLPFPDASFDAVFDFGILHHVPAWQLAVAEISRVLKPHGRFFFEEVTRAALNRWLYRTFFQHPKENRFSESEFVAELQAQSLSSLQAPTRILAGDIFIGVARKQF